MSIRDVSLLLLLLVAVVGLLLVISQRLTTSANPSEYVRLLSLGTDITDLPKTRHLKPVTHRVIEVRKQELAEAYGLNPKNVLIWVKGVALLNKFEEYYTVTFELDIKGVYGLYSERYTIRTQKKRVFKIIDVKYDHKCTVGKIVQK